MQSSSLVQLQPPGHGPVREIWAHSLDDLGVMPSHRACEMVMIFPTPAASMYAVEIEVFEGADSATLYHARLKLEYSHKSLLLSSLTDCEYWYCLLIEQFQIFCLLQIKGGRQNAITLLVLYIVPLSWNSASYT